MRHDYSNWYGRGYADAIDFAGMMVKRAKLQFVDSSPDEILRWLEEALRDIKGNAPDFEETKPPRGSPDVFRG